MTSRPRRHVIVVQRRLTHYRVPFFELLRHRLADEGLALRLLVGEGTDNERSKRDAGELDWAIRLPTHYLADGSICWQPFGSHLAGAAIVVVAQENRLLYNHWLMLGSRPFKLAYWGHGQNMQTDQPNGWKERFKRWSTNHVDWWFAYTGMSADFVERDGFPRERITILNNSIDTHLLRAQAGSVTADDVAALRAGLGMESGPIGVFIGSLFAEKRLEFLFDAADRIRHSVPDFGLMLVGDGPMREQVELMCAQRPWARYVGAKGGREKALYLKTGTVMLNPGLVGLGILDSFALELPIFTTDCGLHSPEISYLENGMNGMMTADDPLAYAEGVVSALQSPALLESLRAGCRASADKYTVENMAERFASGVVQAIA